MMTNSTERDRLLVEGRQALRSGRLVEADALFREVLRLDPDCFDALMCLSNIAKARGDIAGSMTFAKQAVDGCRQALAPRDAVAYNRLGTALFASGEYAEAAGCFGEAAALHPNDPNCLRNQGLAFQMLGKRVEAAGALAAAVSRSPNSLDGLLELSKALLDINDFTGAASAATKAVSLQPDSATGYLLLAGALIEQNSASEAELELEKGIALDKDGRNSFMIGLRQQSLGRIAEADRSFRQALAREPRRGSFYSRWAHNRRVTETDREMVGGMKQVLGQGGLPPVEHEALLLALGKSLADLGECEEAMRCYHDANVLAYRGKFGDRTFDRVRYSETIDRTISLFSRELFERWSEPRSGSELAVFVVGMIRSGTTLVEQILSSHPGVAAAGEQPFWIANRRRAVSEGGQTVFPDAVSALADEYLELLRSFGPGATRVTDKMPDNRLAAGLIHLALPNARIIYTTRHPVDTCLSIYFTPNRMPLSFAHDPGNIVFAYRESQRLLDHWRTVLPSDRFLEVSYEELVSDPEPLTRQMVAFCGLPWNDTCLRPEENHRAVSTPSMWQVRQPIYRTSMEKWRSFEPWLGPFRELL